MSENKENANCEQGKTVYPFSTEGKFDKAFDQIKALEQKTEELESSLAELEALVMNQINNIKYYINQISRL